MAIFEAKTIRLDEINGGERYQNGDIPDAEAINAPIEAAAYAQNISDAANSKADEALNKVNDSAIGEITLSAYPIGSVYISVSDISPASLFGGSWEKITDRFLIGAGGTYSLGERGGSESVTLQATNLPPHNHRIYIGQTSSDTHEINNLVNSTFSNTSNWNSTYTEQTGKYKDGSGSFVDWGSNTQPISTMPPYLAVNIWKRYA